jgi:hypothetical protein
MNNRDETILMSNYSEIKKTPNQKNIERNLHFIEQQVARGAHPS